MIIFYNFELYIILFIFVQSSSFGLMIGRKDKRAIITNMKPNDNT